MDFKKKLKIRLTVGIVYIILGICLIFTGFINQTENEFVASFGFALTVIGLARLKKYFSLTRNEEKLKRYEIAETDERNIMIVSKARSLTFSLYVIICYIAVIVFSFLNYTLIAQILSVSVFLLIMIYWISYFIIRKKY
ncbi:MAG: hypothetical protein IKU52_03170 [Clostridia bacterium]|nr:hypothetical protein [Clostridia bacterium]